RAPRTTELGYQRNRNANSIGRTDTVDTFCTFTGDAENQPAYSALSARYVVKAAADPYCGLPVSVRGRDLVVHEQLGRRPRCFVCEDTHRFVCGRLILGGRCQPPPPLASPCPTGVSGAAAGPERRDSSGKVRAQALLVYDQAG